jgi:hypothetical protein
VKQRKEVDRGKGHPGQVLGGKGKFPDIGKGGGMLTRHVGDNKEGKGKQSGRGSSKDGISYETLSTFAGKVGAIGGCMFMGKGPSAQGVTGRHQEAYEGKGKPTWTVPGLLGRSPGREQTVPDTMDNRQRHSLLGGLLFLNLNLRTRCVRFSGVFVLHLHIHDAAGIEMEGSRWK